MIVIKHVKKFPSPHPGIINFFIMKNLLKKAEKFPSPHPGIINFFSQHSCGLMRMLSFRPLIRGLSISSFIVLAGS